MFTVGSLYRRLRQERTLAEDKQVGQEIVEQARYEQRSQVAEYNIPSKDALEQEQEYHLYQESHHRRKVEHDEAQPKVARTLVETFAPNPVIRADEIAHHRKLERDDGRKHVDIPIALEDEIRAYPQYKRIYTRTEEAADHKLNICA